MDDLYDFFESLSEDNLKKIPPNIYEVKEGGSHDLKLVVNKIYNSTQFVCEAYYKPITLIVNPGLLKLRSNEKT